MKIADANTSGPAGWSTAATTLLAPVSWGTSYITITELLPAGRPLLVAAGRVAPAGVVLVAVGALVSRWRPRGPDWWRIGLVGLLTFGLFYPLLTVSAYRLPGGVAAAGAGLQPLLVAMLSWPLAGRRPRPLELAVGVAAALGVGLVVIGPGAGFDPVGLLAILGANLSFATGVVLTKRFPAPPTPIAAAGWQMLMGGLVLVPLAVAVEGMPPALTGSNVVGFGYISLVATGLAFVLWINGIRRLPTAAPPLLGLAVPVTGAAVGWAVLGQSLSPAQLTGFVLTLAAIAYGASLHSTEPRRAALPTPHAGRVGPRRHGPVGRGAPAPVGANAVHRYVTGPAGAAASRTAPLGHVGRRGGRGGDGRAPAIARHARDAR